jgi:hypothetical protein
MDQKIGDGWSYGKFKDPVARKHPCLVSYDLLPQEQKMKDHLFLAVVKALLPFKNGVMGAICR